ncbi:MAG: VWA domain-containing protein [Candidatus Hadarchaeales archaeon]
MIAKLACRINKSRIRSNTPQSLYACIEIQPSGEPSGEGVHYCFLIDHSGSMAGSKYQTARETAAKFCESLRPQDHVSVIEFSDKAEVLCSASGNERKRIAQTIRKRRFGLRASLLGAATDMYAGLLRGFQLLNQVQLPARIMLLTDGKPTKGITDVDSFVGIAKRIREKKGTIIALGIGRDYNEDLLAALSLASDGRWYHISDAGEIGDILAKEMSLSQTIVYFAPELLLSLLNGCRLTEAYRIGESLAEAKWRESDGHLAFPLEDLRYGAKYTLALKLDLQPLKEGEFTLMTASLLDSEEKLTIRSERQPQEPAETDPYPRALFTLAQASVLSREAVNDPTKVKGVRELVQTVMKDPTALTEVRRNPELMVLGSTIIGVAETIVKGGLTEEDKKKLKEKTTVRRI